MNLRKQETADDRRRTAISRRVGKEQDCVIGPDGQGLQGRRFHVHLFQPVEKRTRWQFLHDAPGQLVQGDRRAEDGIHQLGPPGHA